jgi:hypothetical protein
MIKEENKDLAYWKANAEEDYMQVPISVLRYISELEKVVKNCSIPAVIGQSEQFYCVSSDALVYGNPCKEWCGDEHCKALCKQ